MPIMKMGGQSDNVCAVGFECIYAVNVCPMNDRMFLTNSLASGSYAIKLIQEILSSVQSLCNDYGRLR